MMTTKDDNARALLARAASEFLDSVAGVSPPPPPPNAETCLSLWNVDDYDPFGELVGNAFELYDLVNTEGAQLGKIWDSYFEAEGALVMFRQLEPEATPSILWHLQTDLIQWALRDVLAALENYAKQVAAA